MPLTTRAVSSRCYPKTFSKAAALARKPSKFTDPAVERIAYRGHPHAILDAEVKGSRPEDSYLVEAEVDESADRIVDFSCDCPASVKYYGICKHVAALVLRYIDSPGSFRQKGKVLGRQTTPELFDLMDAGRPGKSHAAASIDLDMVLTRQTDASWTLDLKVGHPGETFYVVKSIDEFVYRMQRGEHFSYGKKLAFTHTPDILLPKARKIEQFLESALIRRSEVFSQGTSYYYERPRVGRDMKIARSELLSLLAALEGETVSLCRKMRVKDAKTTAYRYDPYAEVTSSTTDALIQKGTPQLAISFAESNEGYEISLADAENTFLISDGQRCAIWQHDRIWLCPPAYAKIRVFLAALFAHGTLFVARQDALRFSSTILPAAEETLGLAVPESLEALKPESCSLRFYLDRKNGFISCRGKAVYGEHAYFLGTSPTSQDSFIRDEEAEHLGQTLLERYLSPIPGNQDAGDAGYFIDEDEEQRVGRLLLEGLPAMRDAGEVFTTDSFARLLFGRKPKIQTSLSLSGGLIDLEVSSDDMDAAEIASLLSSYHERRRFHRMKNGSYLDMAGIDLAELEHLSEDLGISSRQLAKGSLALPTYEAFYLEDRLKCAKRDQSYRKYVERFETERTRERKPPEAFSLILRGYQKEGYAWLSLLADCGFGGILADEMGLGKSVQLISWMAASQKEAAQAGPNLIVCPASLVYNWAAEFRRFAPGLDVIAVAGSKSARKAQREDAEDRHAVIVTSYDILRIDVEDFAEMHFFSCTLDEAQYIKNHTTKVAKAAKLIEAEHRFALTGTPIENRPSEMWSIFDFLMPGLLGSAKHFRDRFEQPIIAGDEEAAASLQALVGPFILRRLKKDVLKDLPEKMESAVFAQMEGSQLKLYRAREQQLRKSLVSHKKGSKSAGIDGPSKIQILSELTRLRQICLDPGLVYDDYKGGSAKLDAIMDLVDQGLESGQKMLVFSQFTSFLDLIASRLKKNGISFYTITGSTPKKRRLELVDRFNEDDVPVFLISLKAGGTGLNLTGASIVIHADPWWNAAAEHQATDRAHRIGQQHAVSVYKVIAKDTIEERIVDLQERKSALAETLMAGADTSLASLSADDLIGLLS